MRWFRAGKVSTLQDELEKAGMETVRTLLYQATSNPAGLPQALERIRHSSKDRLAAMEWPQRKERAAKFRAGVVYIVTIIPALAASIAAWPVIKEWLPR
jgi:hypothetical protein